MVIKWIVDTVNGWWSETTGNVFIDEHADLIKGIITLLLLGLCLAVVVWLVVSVLRFLGDLVDFRGL